ncbi:hypothetical protein MHYP_G00144970 [Metynnis hypsauchen]
MRLSSPCNAHLPLLKMHPENFSQPSQTTSSSSLRLTSALCPSQVHKPTRGPNDLHHHSLQETGRRRKPMKSKSGSAHQVQSDAHFLSAVLKQSTARSNISFADAAVTMTLSVTLCFTAVLFSQYSAVLTTGSVTKNQEENLTMVCTTEDKDPIGLYLHLRCPAKHEVFYYDLSSKTLTIPPEFDRRVTVSGDPKKLTVTITSLRVNESGVYSCVFNFFDGKRVEKETNGALLIVKEIEAVTEQVSRTETSAMPEMLVLVSAITACTVVILCMLVTAVWVIPKVKALCARRRENRTKSHNAVYEDMRAHRMQQI